MKKNVLITLILSLVILFGVSANTYAQRKSVSGAEVTGSYRYSFTGKYKGTSNEIKILALGGGKLKVSFDLTYPFTTSNGEMSANVGQAVGEATIEGDTAIYSTSDGGNCAITIKFLKPGMIKVTQEQDGAGCGFGMNVSAQGTYKKFSSKKPTFENLN